MNTVLRTAYVTVAVVIDIVSIWIYFDFGSTKDERLISFGVAILLWGCSAALSLPVAIWVIYKWANHDRPIFWTIALFIAALPILIVLVSFFVDRIRMR